MPPRTRPALLLLALFGLAAGGGRAQDKKDDKKDDKKAAKNADLVTPDEVSFKSSDGVKLAVIMLHDYKADPNDVAWEDTAQLCVSKGFNVLRFAFRGHGKSTEVIPGDFWLRPENSRNIKGGTSPNVVTKTTIKFTEFSNDYYPMLVQDIAAARYYLDTLNDGGTVNTSSVYLLGAGEAVNLGFLYMASEWSRERQKPNIPVPPQYVSLARQLFPAAEAAGPDIAGAIWVGPTPSNAMPKRLLTLWCTQPATIELRSQTRMLFVTGQKDRQSTLFAKFLFSDALLLDRTASANGTRLVKPDFVSFLREIKGSKATGIKLLGNNLGTEKMIGDFLTEIEKDRGTKTRKTREWDKPLWINIHDYGVGR
jgi:hypothetical protein